MLVDYGLAVPKEFEEKRMQNIENGIRLRC